MKSIHMRRMSVFFFGTGTRFATQVACLISRMNLAARSRLISSPMAVCFGSENRHIDCLIGFVWIHLERVLGEFPGYAWHVRWTPGEDFPVLMEEFDERAFLCGGKASRHHRRLGGVCRVHLVLPCVVGRVELHLGCSLLAQGKDGVVC